MLWPDDGAASGTGECLGIKNRFLSILFCIGYWYSWVMDTHESEAPME